MTTFQALVLGMVQGLTEFLPISSTGHLVLVPWVLGWSFEKETAFIFDVLVQWGTLLAVGLYFRGDLRSMAEALIRALRNKNLRHDPQLRLVGLLLLSALPAVGVGLVVKPLIEETLQNPIIVSAFLLVTALLLALGEISGKGMRKVANLKGLDALWMGLAQTLALFPGVSRSGSTISAGLLRGLQRGEAARFSFLMAFPVMLGAGVLALRDLVNSAPEISQLGPLVIGFLAAALIGYLSIRWLLNYLRTRSFRAFSLYCALVGISGLIYGLLNG